jgi:ribosomal protein S12 methylthiotransferase accessory factor
MAGITLKPCPKVYILETHRSKSPADTLRFIEGMKETLGMKSFQDATSLDRIGLPVFTCWRIRPDHSKTWHTGKGFTAVQAQVSLTMEGIERYCSEFREEYRNRLVLDSYRNLRKKGLAVLDPNTLILPQFSQYAPDDIYHWVSGHDLIGDEEILIPACAVYHPFHLEDEPLINTHTDGIASGNTLEEAVFHALMEVIERDAWSIAKFSGDPGDAVAIGDRPENRFLLDIVDKFNRAEIEIIAKDITSDIGIPVIAAFSRDLKQEDMIPIDGFGAHLDPKVAMARALTEVATTRALFIQKYGFDGLREDLPAYYFMDNAQEDFRFYAHAEKDLADMEVGYHEDLLEDIKQSSGILQSHGYERLIVVDLTRTDVGLPTVRVIVPGMEAFCFDRTRKGPRLFRGRD